MARSVRVRPTCLPKVKVSLRRNGYIRQSDLAESLELSQSTISNFLNGKPVDYLNFLEICRALSLEWKDLADLDDEEKAAIFQPVDNQSDAEKLRYPTKSRVVIELRATLEEIDKPLLDALIVLLQERAKDMSLVLKKIEIGSVILVLEGSPSGCKRLVALFKQGQLTELLNIPVLSARISSEAPVPDISPAERLELFRQELENLFAADWQPPELVLADNSRGFGEINADARSGSVKRAKQIHLGAGPAIAVIVQMTVESEEEVGIGVRVYPAGGAIHLPAGLQVAVLDEFGVVAPDLLRSVSSAADSLKLEFSVEPGERFSIRFILGDISVVEEF